MPPGLQWLGHRLRHAGHPSFPDRGSLGQAMALGPSGFAGKPSLGIAQNAIQGGHSPGRQRSQLAPAQSHFLSSLCSRPTKGMCHPKMIVLSSLQQHYEHSTHSLRDWQLQIQALPHMWKTIPYGSYLHKKGAFVFDFLAQNCMTGGEPVSITDEARTLCPAE